MGRNKRPWDLLVRVELKDGRVWFIKCDRIEVDGRRVYFVSSDGRIVRSWLLTNVSSWDKVKG